MRGGEYVEDVLDLLLANVRTPDIRRGDLRAQIAANNIAEERVGELMERRGKEIVLAAFEEVISYAEKRTREAIRELPDGEHSAEDFMEGDGITDEDIPIRATVDGRGRLHDDGLHRAPRTRWRGNINCPLPVTRSACYFALRVLLPKDIPANAGTYAPLEIEAPEGSLVNATYPAAVVAGNVETSNRIADTVLAAFSGFAPEAIPAQGQGTMNNTIIGGRRRGLDLLRDHRRRPGRLRQGPRPLRRPRRHDQHPEHPHRGLRARVPDARRALRAPSTTPAARAKTAGGDGIERSVRVLEPASLSLLTDRRRHPPRGVDGGEPGKVGENLLNDEELPPKTGRELEEGDVVTVHTPGGGGYGLTGG